MPAYDVTIRATVDKTIRVEADSEASAVEQAHSEFTTACDGSDENYEEVLMAVSEVK